MCPWDVAFSSALLVPPPQMAEHIEGVRVVCEQPLHVQLEDRGMKYQWKFRIHSQVSPALCSGRLRAAGSPCCCARSLSFGVFCLFF